MAHGCQEPGKQNLHSAWRHGHFRNVFSQGLKLLFKKLKWVKPSNSAIILLFLPNNYLNATMLTQTLETLLKTAKKKKRILK